MRDALSDETINAIHTLKQDGLSQRKIASTLGISLFSVQKYSKGANNMTMNHNTNVDYVTDTSQPTQPTPEMQTSPIVNNNINDATAQLRQLGNVAELQTELQAVKQGMSVIVQNQKMMMQTQKIIIEKLQELEYANQERISIQNEHNAHEYTHPPYTHTPAHTPAPTPAPTPMYNGHNVGQNGFQPVSPVVNQTATMPTTDYSDLMADDGFESPF